MPFPDDVRWNDDEHLLSPCLPSNCAPPPGGAGLRPALRSGSGNYAYIADNNAGLQVIDVSDPGNCLRVGGYVAEGSEGIEVIDVSNPVNCVRVGYYDTRGSAQGVAVAAGRIYVADWDAGLLVLPTIPNVQFTVRVEAETNQPFTLEAATDLSGAGNWSPLVTTNVPAMPFDFVDFDVRIAEKPRKFYRVRQP